MSNRNTEFHCDIVIQQVAGDAIYESHATATAGAVLESLNITKLRFVEWLDRESKDRESDEGGIR